MFGHLCPNNWGFVVIAILLHFGQNLIIDNNITLDFTNCNQIADGDKQNVSYFLKWGGTFS